MSFSDIPPLTAKPQPSDPFEIFARRPSLAGTPNDLWGGQRDALQAWVKARKKNDVLISLNTGSGKTMLGVLIAQSMANEKAGKCVYVCSTIDLVLQTEREASKLGISPTTYHGSQFSNPEFEQGKTFCITTYPSIFNANTTFKRHNVNKFIFDDAHVAEKAIRDAFTLNISRTMYPDLFARVARLLSPTFAAAGQSFKFKEVMEQKDSAIVLVPPMYALAVADEISEEIRKALGGNLDLVFPYMYIRDKIKLCGITVSGGSIEISPPFLPAAVTFPFSQEDMRRVYLSATLQTQAEFARAFGKKPDVTIEPETDAGNGERCILFGHSVPDEDTGPKLATAIKAKQKLVITCRSYPEAKPWETLAVIPKREVFSTELETFKNATTGAFVLVARVDGIDLSPSISCWNTPKLWDGLKGLEQVCDAPQAAREPRRHAAQDVLRLLFRASAFGGRGVVGSVPLSRGHGKIERQRHDQDQPGQPVRVADLAVFQAEATRFEVGEHWLNAPAPGVVERGEVARGLGHGDDPGLLVARVLDKADVGAHPARGELHSRQIRRVPGQFLNRACVSTVEPHTQIALQSQPVVPAQHLAVGDQSGRAVEPVAQQPHTSLFRQPSHYGVEQAFLHAKANGTLGLLHPPSQRQGALTPAQGQHEDLMPLGRPALIQDQVHPLAWPRFGLRPRQHLACERQHHRIALDQRVRQHAHDPLVAHVDPVRLTRQGGRQRHQVGAALAQHGRNQKRQVLPLRLALPGQPLMQHHADAPGHMLDPAHPNTQSV